MSLIITIAAFLLAIGILVTIHELGHYWAARLCDVKIIRFSVGFGKTIFVRRVGPDQTEWAIAILPLGGFVKMADERDESIAPVERGRAFNNKTVWQRMFIIAAGPAANFVLAAFLYWLVFMAGQPGAIPFVAAPTANTPATLAGFTEYDRIISINGNATKTWGDARLYLLDLAAARSSANVEVETRAGQVTTRQLAMDSIETSDLDKDFLAKLGLNGYRLPVAPVVAVVAENSAAALAGLKPDDKIIAVNGGAINEWRELVAVILKSAGKPVSLTIESRGELFETVVTPQSVTERGQTFGRIGVQPKIDEVASQALLTDVRYGPVDAAVKGITRVWEMSLFSLKMLGRMLTGDVSLKSLSGPITIADYAGQSAKLGLTYYLGFLALISVSIGVLNLLPIPVLDGGQLLYHMVEIIKGSPVSDKAMEIGQRIGFALLLALTAFAFFNDIQRLVSG